MFITVFCCILFQHLHAKDIKASIWFRDKDNNNNKKKKQFLDNNPYCKPENFSNADFNETLGGRKGDVMHKGYLMIFCFHTDRKKVNRYAFRGRNFKIYSVSFFQRRSLNERICSYVKLFLLNSRPYLESVSSSREPSRKS